MSTPFTIGDLNPIARYRLIRAGELRLRDLAAKWQAHKAQGDPDFVSIRDERLPAVAAELTADWQEVHTLAPDAGMTGVPSTWALGGAAVAGALDAALGTWAAGLVGLVGVAGWLAAPPVVSAASLGVARGVGASLLYLAGRDLARRVVRPAEAT